MNLDDIIPLVSEHMPQCSIERVIVSNGESEIPGICIENPDFKIVPNAVYGVSVALHDNEILLIVFINNEDDIIYTKPLDGVTIEEIFSITYAMFNSSRASN